MAAIYLPHLTPQQALALFEALCAVTSALWDEHEPEIGRLAAQQAEHEAMIEYEEAQADDADLPF